MMQTHSVSSTASRPLRSSALRSSARRLGGVFVALALFAGCKQTEKTDPTSTTSAALTPAAAPTATVTAGFIYVGSRGDYGYNQAHAEGAKALAALPGVKVREEENVPETVAVQKTMESMINLDGARLIEVLLTHPNKWTRHEALRILGDRRDASLIPALRKIVEAGASARTLDALWALNLCGGFTADAVLRALGSRHPDVRRWAVRLVGDARRASPDVARALEDLAAGEADREVRSQLASTAKRLPAPHALPIVRRLLEP